ncbi:hypothetical protein, variant [Aphanomyces invadans]|uniref:Uncharacterized protein n=1 Tax=Aphanomyces invadans TaxID=157072 RepID=A0A024U0P4_9STRA|nr:hypothetical protein, variant [Aphanomyces invadans]ETV99441.1 hypothetical protein, variant [Aphanomyces invadans]|eukprot:XP_008871997.1 hypothetical protein, variant [Aphanomyces invadans]
MLLTPHHFRQPQHQPKKQQPSGSGAKKQLTKEQEAVRQQRLQEQRSFEERMRSLKNPPQPKPMPSFVLAPPTFTLPSSTGSSRQPSGFQTYIEPLLAKDAPVEPSGPRVQPVVTRPKNVFAVLDVHDDADEPAQVVNPFTMRPATFQVPGQSMFRVAPSSFQVPAPVPAVLGNDDDDL